MHGVVIVLGIGDARWKHIASRLRSDSYGERHVSE